MPDLSANGFVLARLVLERGLAAIYAIAFVVAVNQFPALCGERGLDPAPRFVRRVPFWRAPSLFHGWRYSDARLRAVAVVGIAVSAMLVIGLPQRAPLPVTMLSWLLLWVLYQSIVNIGGTFYRFGWETMLLEAGFLAVFLGNADVAPQWPVLIAFRWLAFRVEFGAGLIKLRGDACWRKLTCMEYHHATQPMPNALSRTAHQMPPWFHKLEVAGNFAAQLALPFGLFLPQPVASIAALSMIGTQAYLVTSGNYAWLNWLTMLLLFSGVGDGLFGIAREDFAPTPSWFTVLVLLLSAMVLSLSRRVVANLMSPDQAMNASFDPLRLVNTYGAFGSVSRQRVEVIVEGTIADEASAPETEGREHEFKAKPGATDRRPPQIAPYHPRLDWPIWFIPLSPRFAEGWFVVFLRRLLEADRATLKLLRRDPFDGMPPTFVRARMFRYRFTRRGEGEGAIWHRELLSDYVRPMSLTRGAEIGGRVVRR